MDCLDSVLEVWDVPGVLAVVACPEGVVPVEGVFESDMPVEVANSGSLGS